MWPRRTTSVPATGAAGRQRHGDGRRLHRLAEGGRDGRWYGNASGARGGLTIGDRRLGGVGAAGSEDHIDPVVGRLEGAVREAAAAAVAVDAVAAVDPVRSAVSGAFVTPEFAK